MLEYVSQGLRHTSQAMPPFIRLGTPREFFPRCCNRASSSLRASIQLGTARVLLEALQRGDLDIVVATERLDLKGVEYRKLEEERFLLVGSNRAEPSVTQPTNEDERSTLEHWLIDQPWVSYGLDLPMIRRFWRQSFTRRPLVQLAMIIPDLHSIARAVALGLGLSVLSAYLCRQAIQEGHLQVIWDPPQPVTNDLSIAYRTIDRQRLEVVHTQEALRPR